ncbi:MAG: hypothetical protein H8E55_40940 [Pelagibacterales bacterium]|jgi:hypothetical protein|nr:hypothetical protein [Pelagibacterales bacterium]
MPALTHGRVKNGFNGPIRKKNAKANCPRAPNAIKVGCNKTNVERRGALIGGIGSVSTSNRAAIHRRVCSGTSEEQHNNCK